MTDRKELPLRIDDSPNGPVIRALCGAESAAIGSPRVRATAGHTAPDASPAALLRMVMHARSCRACQYSQLELDNQRILT